MKIKIYIIVGIVLFLLFLPYLFPLDVYSQRLEMRLQTPSLQHILGTDFFGRDVFSRLLLAISNSLLMSLLAVCGAVILGLGITVLARSLGSVFLRFVELSMDSMLAIPVFLVCLVLVSLSGSGKIIIVLGQMLAFFPLVYRVCSREIQSHMQKEYIKIAESMGQRRSLIIKKHVFPFLVPKLSQQMISLVSISISIESGLSYLGFGIAPPEPSLGNLLFDARSFISTAPWYIIGIIASISLLLSCTTQLANAVTKRYSAKPFLVASLPH